MLRSLDRHRWVFYPLGALLLAFGLWCGWLIWSVSTLRGDLERQVGCLKRVQAISEQLAAPKPPWEKIRGELRALDAQLQRTHLPDPASRRRVAELTAAVSALESAREGAGDLPAAESRQRLAQSGLIKSLRAQTSRLSARLARRWTALYLLAAAALALAVANLWLGWLAFRRRQEAELAHASLAEQLATLQATARRLASGDVESPVAPRHEQYDDFEAALEGLRADLVARLLERDRQREEIGTLNEELRHQIRERSTALEQALARLEADGAHGAPAPDPAGRETPSNAGSRTLEDTPTQRAVTPGDVMAGRYAVRRRLGAGGHGSVFEVTRKSDGRALALKLLRPAESPLGRTRFAREARALATIRHPNVVSVHDVGFTDEGQMYLVMDLVEGRDLAQHKHRYGDVPWMVPVLSQVAAGLAAVHEQGIVHRDIKPLNIVISPADAADPKAILVDFGIARLADGTAPPEGEPSDGSGGSGGSVGDADRGSPEALRLATHRTQAGVVVGTPVFLAPELHDQPQQVTPAVDMFAFGVLAHKVLTDLLPFAEPPMLIYSREGRLPELVPLALRCPRLAEEASAVLMRCLAVDPAARPGAAEVAAVLHDRGLT